MLTNLEIGGLCHGYDTLVCPSPSLLHSLIPLTRLHSGYDQGVFGGVIVTPDFLQVHNLGGDEHTSLLGTVTAIYDIGCFFGAVAASWIGEKLGRKKSVLVGTTIMTVGAILQISSYSTAQMIVGRIIAGIGNGINTATGKHLRHNATLIFV